MNLRISIVFFILTVEALFMGSHAQNLPTSCVNGRVRYGINPLPGSTVVWTVNGGTIITDYRDSIDIKWGNSPGIKSVSYREINSFGCSSPEGTGFVMLNAPNVSLGPDQQFCIGDSANLNAGLGFTSYRWNDGSVNPDFTARTSGLYWVEVTDDAGCMVRDSIMVAVNTLPVVNLGPDEELCNPRTITLDAGSWASYLWSKGGSNSSTLIAEEGDGSIWVRVTDFNGCIGSDTINILKCIVLGEIPNGFTPNGDNINDVWHIGKSSDYPNMIVKIYDRWGRLVFTSERGYGKPWDGYSKGKPLPMDTYYYIIDFGNGSEERVGSVAIIR